MNKVYLTIDFEDWSHDFKRLLNIDVSASIRENAIYQSYEIINNFCKNLKQNSKITFFCTGILAQKYPDIIRQISKDGHEIACHYYFHDLVYQDQPNIFEKNLYKAKEFLQQSSGQEVYGFRAPIFSIKKENIEHYKILSKIFKYDSSFICNSINQLNSFKDNNPEIKNFSILPIPCYKIFGGLYTIRTGGTSLKFFSHKLIINALEKARLNGINPILYLHPYEFMSDRSFYVKYSEMVNLSFIYKLYWSLRQIQWHVVGNRQVIPKLAKIYTKYNNGGHLKNLVNNL